ncbi:hypothetical protein G6F50_014080 [Rhizopus delemar]|uniref:Uncharacterized protein n=1 Tax=Rhizopus delemar TaxID=936053 RepID=A0A9P7C9Y9_9FUNG|nr:hypothetical protein G6F50_014080 [Rhizopus delemar]
MAGGLPCSHPGDHIERPAQKPAKLRQIGWAIQCATVMRGVQPAVVQRGLHGLRGNVQRLRQVRETAVDAEQFVAACQALAGGVDQHHDRSMGMRGGAGQHGFGQCQCVVHAHFELVGGADHGHLAVVGAGGSGQHRVLHGNGVATRKQRIKQRAQGQAHGRLRSAVTARKSSVSSSGSRSGSVMPSSDQISRPSRHPPQACTRAFNAA